MDAGGELGWGREEVCHYLAFPLHKISIIIYYIIKKTDNIYII